MIVSQISISIGNEFIIDIPLKVGVNYLSDIVGDLYKTDPCNRILNLLHNLIKYVGQASRSNISFALEGNSLLRDSVLEFSITCKDESGESSYGFVLDSLEFYSEFISINNRLFAMSSLDEVSIGPEFDGNDDLLLDLWFTRKNSNLLGTQSFLLDFLSYVTNNKLVSYFKDINSINYIHKMDEYEKSNDRNFLSRYMSGFSEKVVGNSRQLLELSILNGNAYIDSSWEKIIYYKNETPISIQDSGSGFLSLAIMVPEILRTIENGGFLFIIPFLNTLHFKLREQLLGFLDNECKEFGSQLLIPDSKANY